MTNDPTVPDTTATSRRPNDILAEEVTDALVEAGLISEGHRAQLLAKLKSGEVGQDDWNLWVDMATSSPSVAEEGHNE